MQKKILHIYNAIIFSPFTSCFPFVCVCFDITKKTSRNTTTKEHVMQTCSLLSTLQYIMQRFMLQCMLLFFLHHAHTHRDSLSRSYVLQVVTPLSSKNLLLQLLMLLLLCFVLLCFQVVFFCWKFVLFCVLCCYHSVIFVIMLLSFLFNSHSLLHLISSLLPSFVPSSLF